MSEERKVEEERKAERVPTERVVLRHVEVLLLEDVSEGARASIEELIKADRKSKHAVTGAWLEVSRRTAPTKLAAIEAHAGKAGTPDALVGTFRAPTVTAWKDAEVYAAPPAPLVERTTVD